MRDALQSEQVGGFELQPVGTGGWFALKVTLLVSATPGPLRRTGQSCAACGRPEEVFGVYTRLSDLAIPALNRTFFIPNRKRLWHSPHYETRDVFVTGDVVAALKRHAIKGDSCHRLLTEDEWDEVRRREKARDFDHLPGTCILLY
jgi:hypothetical protein